MALTVDAVALHVVGKGYDDLDPSEQPAIDNLRDMAVLLVERYASGSDIPQTVQDAAVRRLAYHDHWTREVSGGERSNLVPLPARRGYLNPLRASGAMALLSPWKRRRAGVIKTDG